MGNGKTVLVVDDSRLARTVIASIVTDCFPGCSVIQAEDGQAASELLGRTPIDAATLDLNLPGTDGLELAEHLREQYPELPIALVTANLRESVRERAALLGVHFVEKPITERRIVAFLEKFITASPA